MASGRSYVIVRVNIHGDEAMDRLEGIKDRMKDFGPVFRWAGKHLERIYSENFTTMGLMAGRAMLKDAWPPLDAEYGAWKATRFPGAPPLVRTGELFRSVANMTRGPVNAISDHQAEFGISGKIAQWHQFGTENMPARKILFVPRDFDRDFGKKAEQYVAHGGNIT